MFILCIINVHFTLSKNLKTKIMHISICTCLLGHLPINLCNTLTLTRRKICKWDNRMRIGWINYTINWCGMKERFPAVLWQTAQLATCLFPLFDLSSLFSLFPLLLDLFLFFFSTQILIFRFAVKFLKHP